MSISYIRLSAGNGRLFVFAITSTNIIKTEKEDIVIIKAGTAKQVARAKALASDLLELVKSGKRIELSMKRLNQVLQAIKNNEPFTVVVRRSMGASPHLSDTEVLALRRKKYGYTNVRFLLEVNQAYAKKHGPKILARTRALVPEVLRLFETGKRDKRSLNRLNALLQAIKDGKLFKTIVKVDCRF